MPQIFINGQPIEADRNQSVLQAALASGIAIPYFCYHPSLSVAGSCRVCVVQVEGRSWVEIACNMPVAEGLRVLTDSELVREHRKAMLQLTLLNHPIDCGVCDKAGECSLQDYHYAHNGAPSPSGDPKVHATKFHALSTRIVLDNERCILCSRCVRFTREISRSNGLGIQQRGDTSLVRAAESRAFEDAPYSENVVDLCPVGALLSRSFMYKSRVWYLQPTPSVCPGCARGCTVDLWHRKPEWKFNALDARHNTAIERVTPRENTAVNGPWICNKGRDLPGLFERTRATQAMVAGKPAPLPAAIDAARRLIGAATEPGALVSSWGSNEELQAFKTAFGKRVRAFVKIDRQPAAGEVLEDDFLIRADKNPNTAGAAALFAAPPEQGSPFTATTDLVLIWGEGFDSAQLPPNAKAIVLGAYADSGNMLASVFIPLIIQTERRGHYTNFEGVVSAFDRCFAKPSGVADAEPLFALLAAGAEVPA